MMDDLEVGKRYNLSLNTEFYGQIAMKDVILKGTMSLGMASRTHNVLAEHNIKKVGLPIEFRKTDMRDILYYSFGSAVGSSDVVIPEIYIQTDTVTRVEVGILNVKITVDNPEHSERVLGVLRDAGLDFSIL